MTLAPTAGWQLSGGSKANVSVEGGVLLSRARASSFLLVLSDELVGLLTVQLAVYTPAPDKRASKREREQ